MCLYVCVCLCMYRNGGLCGEQGTMVGFFVFLGIVFNSVGVFVTDALFFDTYPKQTHLYILGSLAAIDVVFAVVFICMYRYFQPTQHLPFQPSMGHFASPVDDDGGTGSHDLPSFRAPFASEHSEMNESTSLTSSVFKERYTTLDMDPTDLD